MKPSALPPTPILFACVVWFLHGFGPLSVRSAAVLFDNYKFVCCYDSCFVILFVPMMAGSVLVVLRVYDCRPLLSILSVMLAIPECIVVLIAFRKFTDFHVDDWPFLLALLSALLQILAVLCSMSYDHEYQQWFNDPNHDRDEHDD